MSIMPTTSDDGATDSGGSKEEEECEITPTASCITVVEMTNHIDEGCELQQLVVDDEEFRGGATPPVSPSSCKIVQTSPTTPNSTTKLLGKRNEYERIPTFDDGGIQVSTPANSEGIHSVNQNRHASHASKQPPNQGRAQENYQGTNHGPSHGVSQSSGGGARPNQATTIAVNLVDNHTLSQGTSQGTSQGSITSRSLNRIATAPTISTTGNGPNTRLLFVNEKLSRGPSLMSEHGGTRSSRERAERMVQSVPRAQIKRGATSIGLTSSGSHSHLCHLLPSRSRLAGLDGRSALRNRLRDPDRSCQHHCFLTDVTDVHRMEEALLHLLEDFHSGKLRAFGKDCSMEQMTGIREQQERLARLHFDLGAQGELYPPLSDEGLRAGQENMQSLMGSLEQLSVSIERLHSFSESRESSQQPD